MVSVCTFKSQHGDQKPAVLQNVEPRQGGQAQWKRVRESFGAQLVEVKDVGNPPVDEKGFTPSMFTPGDTYDVIVTMPGKTQTYGDQQASQLFRKLLAEYGTPKSTETVTYAEVWATSHVTELPPQTPDAKANFQMPSILQSPPTTGIKREVYTPSFFNFLKAIGGTVIQQSDDQTQRIDKILLGNMIYQRTGDLHYLGRKAPDVTGYSSHLSLGDSSAATFVELQVHQLNDVHRGKCVKYSKLLLERQPWRKRVTIYLTDLSTLEIYHAQRGAEVILLSRESAINLADPGQACRFSEALQSDASFFGFEQVVIETTIEDSPTELTPLYSLASTSRTSAWACAVKNSDSIHAVKIYSSSDPYARAAMTRELNCLKALSKEMKKTGVVAGVAEILSEGESVVGGNRVQFIVTRRVLQFPQQMQPSLIEDHVEGLYFLHRCGYLNLDIVPRHLGCFYDDDGNIRGSRIDESCARLESTKKKTRHMKIGYSGTIRYASAQLLETLASGKTAHVTASDDLESYAKCMIARVNPGLQAMLEQHSEDKVEGIKAISNIWHSMERTLPENSVLRDLLAAARATNYDLLISHAKSLFVQLSAVSSESEEFDQTPSDLPPQSQEADVYVDRPSSSKAPQDKASKGKGGLFGKAYQERSHMPTTSVPARDFWQEYANDSLKLQGRNPKRVKVCPNEKNCNLGF